MSDATPTAELQFLRDAFQLLLDVEQISDHEGKALITSQILNVLATGQRFPGLPADGLPLSIPLAACPGSAETARPAQAVGLDRCPDCAAPLWYDQGTLFCPRCAAREEADDAPALDAPCDYAERYETPAPEGFTVPERIAALGWHGAPAGVFETHACRITKLVREAWGTRYCGEPIHKGDEDWYMQMHAEWVDGMINTYMGIQPGMQRAPQPCRMPEGR